MALLGELLLTRGILNPDQLSDALAAQERLAAQGLDRLLGDLLIVKGYATPDQIREVLEEQQKHVVICGACRIQFNVGHADLGSTMACPRCIRQLRIPERLNLLNVAQPVQPTYIDPGPAPIVYLIVKKFDCMDQIHPLRDGDSVVLGSGDDVDILVDTEGVEPNHCRVSVNQNSVLATCLAQEEGLYVNGRRIAKCSLHAGDLILLGRAPIVVSPALSTSSEGTSSSATERESLLDADPIQLIGRTIGNYRFTQLLGSGGMATVLMAEQVPLTRMVAVKILRKEMTQNKKAADRFIRESLAGAALNHPNIVQVYDAGTIGGLFFIAMEYVEGEDVGAWIKRYGKLPVNLALSISIQVAIGMEFAHKNGVVHRDIKPSNIMFTTDGRVKILDLGIARMQREASPESRKIGIGTLVYMPPEQTRDAASVDHRADIYSLGASIFKMLTGHPPFKRRTFEEVVRAIRNEPLPNLRELNPEVPENLLPVLEKAMAKKHTSRYESMAQFQQDLVAVWQSLV